MKLNFLKLSILSIFLSSTILGSAQDCVENWLSTNGNKIVDVNGKEVTLAGVNWFGFETQVSRPHGIAWQRSTKGILQQIKDLGFNCIRIPWSNETMFGNKTLSIGSWMTDPYTGNGPHDLQEESEISTPIELLDIIVRWCQENDLKIILDNHSRADDAYLTEYFWYNDEYTTEEWIADWLIMTERYKDYSAVVAMDINNEPHNNDYQGIEENFVGALWGTGNIDNDWRLAAEECGNAILTVNPNVLILVEGTGAFQEEDGSISTYWWGGNLKGAKEYPVRLSDPSKLVYSPHEYGPTVHLQEWFEESSFPNNMAAIWEENFNFLNSSGTAPLLIGEFGIRDEDSLDAVWMETLVNYIKEQGLHFTYWCFNPNSGDTGGILTDDWESVNQWKMDYLEPILSNPIPNCVALGSEGTLSNEEFNAEVADFRVYPNPATELITFFTSTNNLKEVELYNLVGAKVQVQTSTQLEGVFNMNVSNLASGVYLAKVVSEKGVETTVKVVVN